MLIKHTKSTDHVLAGAVAQNASRTGTGVIKHTVLQLIDEHGIAAAAFYYEFVFFVLSGVRGVLDVAVFVIGNSAKISTFIRRQVSDLLLG
jgi:hypothetical protein